MKPYRIIISTPSLNIEVWTGLYRFIDSIYTNCKDENKIDALHCLKERCIQVWRADESNTDVYKLDGQELSDDELKQLPKYTCYSILYQNSENTEEYTALAQFVFFFRRFIDEKSKRSLVSLGIGTDGIKNHGIVNNFYFKCSNFFCLYDIPDPILGEKTIYFFFPKAKNKTRILAGIGKDSLYPGDPNRRFLPLLPITEENYHSIFTTLDNDASKQSKVFTYINDSLNLIKNSIRKNRASKLAPITDYTDSLFGQWLINGYFNSYESHEIMNMSPDDIKGTIQTLQIYRISIFELIQNIIFHGGKEGLFYCAFDKKENVSSYYQNKLPDLGDEASKVNRFLRVGIYDFHETGIVDSFKEREQKAKAKGAGETYNDMSLIDFFDTESIKTIGISELEMRYAASLGIKSFVRTVFKHKGYFSVESNELVDGHNSKKRISSIWKKDDKPGFLSESIINDNAAGTHYEIILPVMPTPSLSAPTLQRETFFNLSKTLQSLLGSYNPIKVVDLDYSKIAHISDSATKAHQVKAIKKVGNDIIKSAGDQTDEIALNLKGYSIDHTLMFKILAYIQLNAKHRFKKIILTNGTDDFVNDFCRILDPFLSDKKDDHIPIWSDDAAIILMSDKFHVQIICGEKKEVLYALNHEFEKYYSYNSFPENANKPFTFKGQSAEYTKDKLPGEFILPYDILVEPKQRTTLFESYALDLLKRNIISNDIGFLVNHKNTYIGNKIIVKNYYEADLMFQNSFFAERFAFLIAKNIRKIERKEGRQLVLIGYQQYSEYLLKAIKRVLNDKTVHIAMAIANDETAKEKAKDQIVTSETAFNESTDDENHAVDIELSFNFDIDGNNSELHNTILNSPEKFQFATIVPIGATLSTNDKIVALFKLWHKLHDPEKKKSTDIDFVYNHCVIIVRDKIDPEPTLLEKEQQWKEIHLDRNKIVTDFRNTTEIHYTIQTANADHPTDNNWIKRLNKDVSFKDKWEYEEYVNFTENSSINSQNLMGFPKVDTSKEIDHQKELDRLFMFKDDIYKGHFDAFKSHHKYFFDTESFVRKGNKKFNKWLSEELKSNTVFNLNNLNIIITPNAETESDLVCAVNDQIFDGNALIVYLDVKNWRNNIVYKLSFLKKMNLTNVSFHYVDHLLLTGETYHRTKSYLYSIKGGKKPIRFDSIITVINRLPITNGKEIKNDVNHFFAFINLYYPTSKLDGRECELCKLQRYYDDLSKKTVLDSCKQVIKKNVDKLICKSRKELEQGREKRDAQQTNRDFLRLVITHELYYRISQIAWGQANNSCCSTQDVIQDYDSTKRKIYEELDAIYCKLCNIECPVDKNTESDINDRINGWYKSDFPEEYSDLIAFHNQKLETDKKIAFLKVISSPPLSKYIIIRQYAHSKLLHALYEIIKEKNETDYTYDDLKIVKSILKSLSFLKSNALVRKDVIVGVWKVLGIVIKPLGTKQTSRINGIEKKTKEIITGIDTELRELNEKSQLTISEGERRNHLISVKNQENIIFEFLNAQKKEEESLFKIDAIIKDFSRDVQFFIKNAIVEDDAKATFLGELIRQGEEIHSFDNIEISKTKLSIIDEKNSIGKNNLFEFFKDKTLYPNNTFRKEYIDFLVWLFYDNTTITRKTLDNFSKELEKDNTLRSLFKDEDKLKNIESFKENIGSKEKKNSIMQILYDKIKGVETNEYYYSFFKPYLDNGDKFDYLEKLIRVTYAKLKLEDLIKHKKGVETDIKDLLNILSGIMDADAAFLTMKFEKKRIEKSYPIALFIDGNPEFEKKSYPMALFIDGNPKKEWKYDEWLFDDFITKKYIEMNVLRYPIIPFYNIPEQRCGERRNHDLGAHSLNIFVIEDQLKQERATITFIYNENNHLIVNDNEESFRIHTQESGRLLLLLKNEISEYLINFLVKDRVFELWTEKQKNLRKFKKIYSESNHTFNSVYDEMEEFEKIGPETLKSLYRTWFILSNETISFFYSDIERNMANGSDAMHCLSLGKISVAGDENTLGETFNSSFITILSCLLDGYWNNKHEIGLCQQKKNEIYINDQDIHQFELSEKLIDAKVGINKHLLRTFIAQCLHNSLALRPSGGHRRWRMIKRIDIRISKKTITISDSVSCDFSNFNSVLKKDVSFRMKQHHIESIDCDEYSSTTLTTLQGVINYLNSNREDSYYNKYQCEYGFNKNNNFFVKIKF